MSRTPINPNAIDWSGENPSITLKGSDGETTCLVSFFRVVVSPHGPGNAVFILTDPGGSVFRIVQYEPGVTPRNHRTDSIDDAYEWIVRQLAEKALGQPGATL